METISEREVLFWFMFQRITLLQWEEQVEGLSPQQEESVGKTTAKQKPGLKPPKLFTPLPVPVVCFRQLGLTT